MPRACTICTHPQHAEIESDIIHNAATRAITAKYHISDDALLRHKKNCINIQLKLPQEEMEGLDVVGQLKKINEISLEILEEARKAEKPQLALQAIDKIMRQLELQAKLLGSIDKHEVNVWLPVPWEAIELAIYNALKSHPDARVKVVEALASLEEDRR